MRLSDRIKTSMAEGSWIGRMLEEGTILKRQHGDENVFDPSLGDPVMEPPPQFHKHVTANWAEICWVQGKFFGLELREGGRD